MRSKLIALIVIGSILKGCVHVNVGYPPGGSTPFAGSTSGETTPGEEATLDLSFNETAGGNYFPVIVSYESGYLGTGPTLPQGYVTKVSVYGEAITGICNDSYPDWNQNLPLLFQYFVTTPVRLTELNMNQIQFEHEQVIPGANYKIWVHVLPNNLGSGGVWKEKCKQAPSL